MFRICERFASILFLLKASRVLEDERQPQLGE
jgi:hypothetical protein